MMPAIGENLKFTLFKSPYMKPSSEDIKQSVREYIIENFTQNDVNLTDDLSLIKGGVIDSITTLQLVEFLEEKFSIEFAAHEVDADNLDTIDKIADFVGSKLTS